MGLGDTVRIVNDEEAVRSMQNGHGGWNTRMKNVRRIRCLPGCLPGVSAPEAIIVPSVTCNLY